MLYSILKIVNVTICVLPFLIVSMAYVITYYKEYANRREVPADPKMRHRNGTVVFMYFKTYDIHTFAITICIANSIITSSNLKKIISVNEGPVLFMVDNSNKFEILETCITSK